ncbi:MAG: MFS transporter, partial [Dehalococcoidales bacterium]
QAIYPTLITPSVMTSAVALNSAIWQGVRIIAPALAGFIIPTAGTSTVFYLASKGFVVLAFVMIRLNVPPSEDRPPTSPFGELVQ